MWKEDSQLSLPWGWSACTVPVRVGMGGHL